MRKLTQHKMDNHFYQELINRFFQSHSYFFLCLKYYLETNSLFKADEAIHPILARVIAYLAGSRDAASELREISKIKGFENFYAALESRLQQINFQSLQPTQFKTTIQNLAVFLLKSLAHLLAENESRCADLNAYLQLKVALRQLLNNTNGAARPQNDPCDPSQKHNHQNLNSARPELPTSSLVAAWPDAQSDARQLQNFNQEVYAMLNSLRIAIPQSHDAAARTAFLAAAHNCFFRLMGLAMYTGARPVQTIAERVITLLEIISTHRMPINDFIVELIHRAKTSIQSKAYQHENQKVLMDLFDDYDRYIALLREQISNRHHQSSQQDHVCDAETRNAFAASIEPFFNFKSASQVELLQHPQSSNNNEDATMQNDDNQAFDEKNSPTPFADNANGSKPELAQHLENTIAYAKNEPTSPGSTLPKLMSIANNGKDDNYLYSEIFSEEAEVYYKMILNATLKLKGEGNAQSCLEDIELASYSIKLLARKFGMEKIAALPEIIESLSYQANRRLVKLPIAMVQSIEEAASLLAMFDYHQTDHRIRFNSILAALKQYYEQTFQTRDVVAVAP